MAKLRMIVDGWSSSNVAFGVFSADTRRAFPARQWITGTVPQSPNRALLDPEPEYEPRVLEVVGHLSSTGGSTGFVANRNELAARMDRDAEVQVSFSDSTDRLYFARLNGITHEHLTKRSLADDEIKVTFDLLRPWRYGSTTTSTTGIGSTAVTVALGTAPTKDVVLTVTGPTTSGDWDIVYENSTGGSVHTVGFSTVTLSSSTTFVELDMLNGTIVDESSDSLQASRDTGTRFPFALDPRDGQWWNDSWPRLRVTSGSLKVTWRNAYS